MTPRFIAIHVLTTLIAFCAVSVSSVMAHVPLVVEQDTLRDITPIEEPHISQAFYGRLSGLPHTYEIRATEPFTLFAEVLIPDIPESKETVSGIVIKEVGKQGRVTEVARMLGKEAVWESFYEPWGGDRYRRGTSYEGAVEPGVYRIEVSTPDNDSPYVLVVGKEEDFGMIGYVETVKRIADVKVFFGKSRLHAIESPLVWVPLVLGILLMWGGYWYRNKRRRTA